MLAYFESYTGKSEAGRLNAPNWRNVYLNDNRVFTKVYNNDIGNLSVEFCLMIPSQHERRNNRSEAYISKLYSVPNSVRVYSFQA